MDREMIDYLLDLVLNEQVRLERRIWYAGEGDKRIAAFAKNDRAQRALSDLLDRT